MRVSQTELARILGVTPRTIRDYHGLGLEDHRDAETGSYDLPGSVNWRLELEWKRALESRTPEEADELLQHRTRKMAADAELREDELRMKRGELVPVHEVLDRVRKPLEAVDGQLRSAPRRLARDWAHRLGVTQGEAIALIGDLVEEVRADVRELFADDTDGAAA